ncbi:hypothetical protein [Helicobacter sp. MIT 14-3879]|uniref:hypothetical protein n=1 Tax=Helicobacter sp. MIT 14-3879 TaxID=2040649 RepID=UPI000E1E3445|nr:hypothetical protein [Helicobacter sp. MIT 14-3879]RDU61432.1 hypothetical protein CQA44_08975 [Helicobacter sp. MIT 14-3879]
MDFFSTKKLKAVKNWAKDLSQFCVESDLSFNECSFHVTAVHTILTKDDKELPKSFFKESYDQTKEEIYQVFDVEITPQEYDFSKLNFTFSDRHLEATLVLQEGFLIDDGKNYLPQLADFIIAFLIQKNIIITSLELIKSRLEKIISENFTPPCTLMEDKRFTFLRSKAATTHKGFTNLLKKRWCKENDKAAIKGALYAVSENEPIGFFLKDAIITSGRNLQGEFIDMKQLVMNTPHVDNSQSAKKQEAQGANFQYKVPPEAGDGITKIEEGAAIKYEANGHGIVELAEVGLRLIDIVTFQQVSVKTGCILGGFNKSVEIDIDCPDHSKDAVQTGAIIEAEVVNIKGNVGERTIIRAKRLSINGQTHQSAILHSEEASITIHKGVLYSNEIDIDKLEGGKIYGKDINVLETQGAKIVGNRVIISKLHSNTSISFSEKLHLKAVHGSDNQISFDIFADSEQKQILSTVIQRDSLLENNIAARVVYCKGLADKLQKIKPIIESLRPVVERSKKEGFELDVETRKTLGFYVLLLKQIKEQRDYANKLQEIRVENTRKGEEIEQMLNEAKITTESSWKDNNQIILTRRFPPSEKKIFTQDSEMFEVFINDDGEMEKNAQ